MLAGLSDLRCDSAQLSSPSLLSKAGDPISHQGLLIGQLSATAGTPGPQLKAGQVGGVDFSGIGVGA